MWHPRSWSYGALLSCGALLLGIAAQAPAASAAGGTLFGSTVQLRAGELWSQGITRVERVDGHLPVVRVYQTIPQPSILGPLGGRSGIVSFRLPPAEVLSGTHDAAFRAFFAAAPKDHVTWWSYYHEADVAYQQGRIKDLAQFRAASTHVAELARASGNSRLRNAVILVDWTADPHSGLTVAQFMPRADLVDVIGWDDYNGWYTQKGTYGDPTAMITMNRTASAKVGKPFAVAEFGSLVVHRDSAGRAAWITRFSRAAGAQGARFVSYYDSDDYGRGADYRLLDRPSQQAFHAIVSGQQP